MIEGTVAIVVAQTVGSRGALWSPRFPRAEEVGWWIVLGTQEGELLALKRVSGCYSRADFDLGPKYWLGFVDGDL